MPFRTAAIAGALLVAFLTATLAPCPPLPAAAALGHEHGVATQLSWVAACPCGCERPPPVAGGSVRLGVARLPASPEPFVRTEAARAPAPLAPPVEAFGAGLGMAF